jgi:Ribbon-helix-helix protein, copG family
MKRITVDLEEAQFERLRKAAFDGREPMSVIVRDAVKDYLDRHETTERGTMPDLETEKVTENYQPEPGQMDTRTFWIAYPSHVAGYGHTGDRISRATGRGKTRKAALADAGTTQTTGETS